jgi:hypothetical protein
MDYNHITNFLDKFKKLIFQKEELKEIVIRVISEEIHHQIKKESLKIKGAYIYIEGSPILRSEILIHKKQILEKIKLFLPDNNFLDIK